MKKAEAPMSKYEAWIKACHCFRLRGVSNRVWDEKTKKYFIPPQWEHYTALIDKYVKIHGVRE